MAGTARYGHFLRLFMMVLRTIRPRCRLLPWRDLCSGRRLVVRNLLVLVLGLIIALPLASDAQTAEMGVGVMAATCCGGVCDHSPGNREAAPNCCSAKPLSSSTGARPANTKPRSELMSGVYVLQARSSAPCSRSSSLPRPAPWPPPAIQFDLLCSRQI